jgi:hypothetical protein
MQQALQMATTDAQLALLPIFPNDPKGDKSFGVMEMRSNSNKYLFFQLFCLDVVTIKALFWCFFFAIYFKLLENHHQALDGWSFWVCIPTTIFN